MIIKVKEPPALRGPFYYALQRLLQNKAAPLPELPVQECLSKGDNPNVAPWHSNTPVADRVRVYASSYSVSSMSKVSDITGVKQGANSSVIFCKTLLFGADKAGRNILRRLTPGVCIIFGICLMALLILLMAGIPTGAVDGYFGRSIDDFILFPMTVVWSVPSIVILLAISLTLGSKGMWLAFVAVGLTVCAEIIRVVYGRRINAKETNYGEAAKVLSISHLIIMLRHLLLSMPKPLIFVATGNFAPAILRETGLSYLRFGVQPPAPLWCMRWNEGFQLIGAKSILFLVVLPCISIDLLNLPGNVQQSAYNPKTPISNG